MELTKPFQSTSYVFSFRMLLSEVAKIPQMLKDNGLEITRCSYEMEKTVSNQLLITDPSVLIKMKFKPILPIRKESRTHTLIMEFANKMDAPLIEIINKETQHFIKQL